MNAYIMRSGNVAINSGDKILPGERVVLRADSGGYWTTAVDMKIWNTTTNELLLTRRVLLTPVTYVGTLGYVAPEQEGNYAYQADGVGIGDVSEVVYFTVSHSAPEPPPPEKTWMDAAGNVLKWGAVFLVGFYVVKSGLLDSGAEVAKRKLNKIT